MEKLIWKTEVRNVRDLIHWNKNPRKITEEAFEKLKERIKTRGFHDVIKIDIDNTNISGNQRQDALIALGIEKVNVLVPNRKLTEKERDEIGIESNRNDGQWDFDILGNEFETDLLKDVGFTDIELGLDIYDRDKADKGVLVRKFMIPPFSVFDVKQGYWQNRKKIWIDYLGDSGEGRDDSLLGEGLNYLAKKQGGVDTKLTGTSIFDPVLAEISYRWFVPDNGSIFDPFAGGNCRGIVAGHLGYKYLGIDLSKEQVKANEKKADELFSHELKNEVKPVWICADSADLNKFVKDKKFDFIFSCPPYGDLEVYSDDPNDLSNLEHKEMIKKYRQIIKDSVDHLKDNRFCCFVVGDYRNGKTHFYRNFVSDTIQAFQDAGAFLYNEVILATSISTLSLRAGNYLRENRKIGKSHQNVLIFYKGNPKDIKKHFKELDFSDEDIPSEDETISTDTL